MTVELPTTARTRGGPGPDTVTVIEADSRRSPAAYLAELASYRDLFYFLVRRDVKARYVQTVLGVGWAVLQPVTTMVVFSVFFGRLAKIPSSGLPYPVFSLAALVPWTYFTNAVNTGSISVVGNVGLLRKVYFPRLLIPLAPICSALVDLLIALVVLFAIMAGFGYYPEPVGLLLLPLLIAITVVTAAGLTLWLAPLAVQYRDIRFITPFFVQLLLFVTPVIYPLSVVPEHLRPLYAVNPMVGVIDAFRTGLLDTGDVQLGLLGISAGVSLALLVSGVWYFRRTERLFADVA